MKKTKRVSTGILSSNMPQDVLYKPKQDMSIIHKHNRNMEYQFLNLPFTLFTFILSLIFLIIKIKKRGKINGPDPNLPPGPWKLPLIGNLHNLIGSLPHRGLSQLAKKHGPVMHLQLGELSTIIISTPETAKIVMKTHDTIFAQRPQVLAIHILTYESKDIAFSHGNYWRHLRKICTTELLSPNRVKSFRSIREEEVQKLVKSISSSSCVGSPFNLSKNIFSLTYGIAGRAVFGAKCKHQEEFISCMQESVKLGGGFGLGDVFPSVKLLRGGMRTKIDKLFHQFDKILDIIIDDHKAKRKAVNDEADLDLDLVDVLLNLHEHGDLEFALTIDNIKAVIMDIFTAGGETSSTTVEWVMSEMIKDSRVMEKAQAEVRKVYGTKRIVDEEGLEELSFLKLVIKETLRLHPPAPLLLPRESQEQCKINGYDIPAKSKVMVNAWAIGRDPRYWTEPDRFYPERFLDSSVDFKGRDFEFVPFGAGRRICPGISFALPNLELPLASFLYHFDWKLTSGVKNEDLDMTEVFGATVRRKNDLCLIPIPYVLH